MLLFYGPLQESSLEAELHHLLAIQAIKPVPLEHMGSGFYLIIFDHVLGPEEIKGSRVILDLKYLNVHIWYIDALCTAFWTASDIEIIWHL